MTQEHQSKSLVLYVDDDSDDRNFLQEAFEAYSKTVELKTFKNGYELLQFLKNIDFNSPSPCLVIIDINMPILDGKDVLRIIRGMKEFEDVPALLFSTSTLPAERYFAEKYNAGFITKPINSNQLHLIVDKMIDHCTDEVKNRIGYRR